MITQDDINADRAAVESAQLKLTEDQSAFDAAQPHMNVLGSVRDYVATLGAEARQLFADLMKSIL